MSEKEKNVPSEKVSFSWFLKYCRVSDDQIVTGSMALARQLQAHYHQSWSLNVEPGDHHVLLRGMENEQHVGSVLYSPRHSVISVVLCITHICEYSPYMLNRKYWLQLYCFFVCFCCQEFWHG